METQFPNETVLPDDYPVYGDYLYVTDGKLYRSDWHDITVRQLKVREGFKEVRRCDIASRQKDGRAVLPRSPHRPARPAQRRAAQRSHRQVLTTPTANTRDKMSENGWPKGWWYEQCTRMDGTTVAEWTVYADQPGAEPDDEPAVIAGVFVKSAVPLIAASPALAEALEELLALPVAEKELKYLDQGIGAATEQAAWLRARAALNLAKGRTA